VNFWKVILAAIVIYGAGVTTGGLFINRVDHCQVHPEASAITNSFSGTNNPALKPAHLPDTLSKQFLQRLDSQLHLTADQRDAVQKIITDGQNLVHKTVQDARLEIRDQLTPDQQREFDEMLKRPAHHPSGATNAPPATVKPPQA
jgi:hypothetical protein